MIWDRELHFFIDLIYDMITLFTFSLLDDDADNKYL